MSSKIGMSEERLNCNICETQIIIYFHKKYAGKRGKCPSCGIDFPLE
jgi:transposase-like protein